MLITQKIVAYRIICNKRLGLWNFLKGGVYKKQNFQYKNNQVMLIFMQKIE